MKYLSVCSGIEAASVAWQPLGFQAVAFAEVDRFPSAVLAHHYPDVQNLGDMTRFKDWPDAAIDVLVGGTPCQSFSVAGLRAGLADPRGNLALTYLAVADSYRPRWLVWENVPGALSVDEGRALGAFLGGFSALGYGWAYRSLDAQYFGLAQRRRRVFVVGHLGDWRRAAAVLFERESLSGHPAPRREAGQDVTGSLASRASAGGGLGTDFDCAGGVVPILEAGARQGSGADLRDGLGIGEPGDPMFTLQAGKQHAIASTGDLSHCLNAGGMGRIDYESETLIAHTFQNTGHGWWNQSDVAATVRTPDGGGSMEANIVAHALRADGFDASEDGTGRGTPIVPIAFDTTQITSKANYSKPQPGDPCHPLAAGAHPPAIAGGMQVRRLTPRECERLQGFPDDYTLIPYRGKPAADGPRYKALGNSMAVPVMAWIGKRLALMDSIGQALLLDEATR